MADALLDAALDLSRRRHRVDDLADVVHRHHLRHGDKAGLGIDLHLDEMRGERVRLGGVIGGRADELCGRQALARHHGLAHGQRGAGAAPHGNHAVGDGQLLRRGFHLRGGAGQQLRLDLAGRHLRRAADHIGGVAGKGADIPRHHVRIAMHHAHAVERDAQFLRHDLRQRGVCAGAQPGGAGQQHHGAVLVHLDDGVALLLDAGVGAAAVHLAPHAPAAPDHALLLARLRAPLRPAGGLHALAQAGFQAVADQRMVGGRDVALAHGVAQLQLGGVDAEVGGGLVHLDVQCVVGLHHAVTPEGAGDGAVGVDATPLQPHVLAAVERDHRGGAHVGHAGAVGAIGARVEHHPGLACGDRAVVAEALAQPDPRRVARAATEEGLFARVFHAHRAARLAGQQRAQELALEQVLLGAEAAAHVVHQHAHLVQRQAQHLGHDPAHHEGGLGGDPYGQVAVAVPLAGQHVRFHVGRRGAPALVDAFEDEVGLGEAALHIAPLDPHRRQYEVAAGRAVVDQRGAGRGGIVHGEHGGQWLVFDLDQLHGARGDLLADGGHGGHAFAPVAHLVVEDVLVAGDRGGARVRRARVQHARHVLMGEHGLHAGQRQCGRGVDAADACMGHIAALHLGVEQAGERHVGDVLRVAGDLVEQVRALDAVSDHGVGHRVASGAWRRVSAVCSMASMILV
ncbi:hypothetical protein D3C87_1160520 [compost metagenome]